MLSCASRAHQPIADMTKSPDAALERSYRELLRLIRKEAGLRQAELASRVGRPQSFVSNYELGERRLDVLELREICNACSTDLMEFVHRLEEKAASGSSSSDRGGMHI